MQFRLIGGGHVEDGKSYEKGDIVESDKNLVSLFRGKFEKVYSEDEKLKMQETPKIPTKESLDKVKEKSKNIETRLGPDVTVSFLEAKGTEFKIHKAAGSKYHIVDGASNVFGGEGFTRNEVLIYLNNA